MVNPSRFKLQVLLIGSGLALAGCQLDGVSAGAFGLGMQQGMTYGPVPYQVPVYVAPPHLVLCQHIPPNSWICD